MRTDTVNKIPDVGHWCFQTWKVDFFAFSPCDLTISDIWISLCIRIGHRIFKWEYLRRQAP